MIKNDPTTMCIIHKGFRGFRAASPASNLGGNLIGLKPEIPYEIIVCQEAAHRYKRVLHALFEMVESSCKLDPPMSFYRRGHQTTQRCCGKESWY